MSPGVRALQLLESQREALASRLPRVPAEGRPLWAAALASISGHLRDDSGIEDILQLVSVVDRLLTGWRSAPGAEWVVREMTRIVEEVRQDELRRRASCN